MSALRLRCAPRRAARRWLLACAAVCAVAVPFRLLGAAQQPPHPRRAGGRPADAAGSAEFAAGEAEGPPVLPSRRSLLAEPRSVTAAPTAPATAAPGLCRSTQQGRELAADDRGGFCVASDIDPSTGCCPATAAPHNCTGCVDAPTAAGDDGGCCRTYENCVSCCLRPDHAQENSATLRHRRATQAVFAAVAPSDPFHFCTVRCRTSSRSVLHQNRYRSQYHYCLGSGRN
eukprot:TRINITY_DN9547_c0_g1_i1.p2 TRINITY_DN9547_c0_g1~~TRINITY_DN9547_c0_g1_i1.p2  ORF type:complete len:230 (+),score=45.68 TRINITY_DN9547_c0_g1_i1:82-771(+)